MSVEVKKNTENTVVFTFYTIPPIALWSLKTSSDNLETVSAYISDTESYKTLNKNSTEIQNLYSNLFDFDIDRNLYCIKDKSTIAKYDSPPPTYSNVTTNKSNIFIFNTKTSAKNQFPDEFNSCSEIVASPFLNNKACLYVANIEYVSYEEGYKLFITPYTITQQEDESTYSCIKADSSYNSALSDLLTLQKKPTDVYTNGSSTITDIAISNGYLYVTIESKTYSGFSNNSINPSCGVLLRFNIDGTSIELDKYFGKNGILGWTDTTFTGIHNEANYYFQISSVENENTAFFGPTKILVIKPKKIWIADVGATFDTSSDKIKQKSRVVVIDLEKQTFESVTPTDAEIAFQKEICFYN